jgi:hypothetical protein
MATSVVIALAYAAPRAAFHAGARSPLRRIDDA